MEKRRSRGSGSSPSGRDAPKSGSRRGSAFRRAPGGKPTPEAAERGRRPRVVRSKRTERVERTFLGLTTGMIVVLAVVVCALGFTLAVPARTYFTQRAEAAQLAAAHQQLETELAALHSKQDQQHDPEYVKAQARERLRLVMPGETPYQVQLPGAYEAEQARRNPTPVDENTWYTDLYEQISQPLAADGVTP